jgi:hypothetical protein
VRIELLMTLLAGFAGGLAGTLWAGLVTNAWLAQRHSARSQPDSATRLLAGAAAYGLCGAAAGFLFWLGWGLVAVIDTPWYLIGALYGVLVWTAAAAPLLAAQLLRLREPPAVLAALAVEGLVASLATGLLCAYVWHRAL